MHIYNGGLHVASCRDSGMTRKLTVMQLDRKKKIRGGTLTKAESWKAETSE